MDNRVFNVNGEGSDMLLRALELIFMQKGINTTCEAFKETKEHGLILIWFKDEGDSNLPVGLTAAECLPMIEQWLKSEFAKTVIPSEWCDNADHDGHNGDGWQVYCENWGHVGGNHYAICGIKPAFMWYGK